MPVDLAFQTINPASDVRPERAIAFLHGILGSGKNLKTVATEFLEQRPGWSACLVDLRGHGESPKGTPEPSVEAAARDVVALATRVGLPLTSIVGHSFGGKVALEVARVGLASLREVVTLDSVPSARAPITGGDSPLAIMKIIESLPEPVASISAFVDSLERAGLTRALGQWLAGSLQRKKDGVRFALDLEEVRALILDYFARDMWPVVESPPGETRIHLVIGERSDSYSEADRQRAMQIAAISDRVTVDVLPAGHWVHVDDPDGVLKTLLKRIG
jgi:pimeloyl-ACP methyl ester carboxylesterase